MKKFLGLPLMKGFTSFSFEAFRVGFITLFYGIGLILAQIFLGVFQSPDISILDVSYSIFIGLILSHISQLLVYHFGSVYMYFGKLQLILYPILAIVSYLTSLEIL